MSKSGFILLIFCFSLTSFGQSILETRVNTKNSRWSGLGSLGASSNLAPRDSYEHQTLSTANLLLAYEVAKRNQLRAVISGYRENDRGGEAQLNDGYLGWANPVFWREGKIFSIGQQLRAILPSSRESRIRDEKLVGVSLIPSFVANLTPIGATGVTLAYAPQLTKNFHRYEQNRLYRSNTEWALGHLLRANWAASDHFYFDVSLLYAQAWSYQGTKKDDSYQFITELGAILGGGLALALGVTNSGTVRDFEQGNDQTVDIFNNRTASVYTELTYAF